MNSSSGSLPSITYMKIFVETKYMMLVETKDDSKLYSSIMAPFMGEAIDQPIHRILVITALAIPLTLGLT